MISPSVRVSFAMRFRRISAGEGKTGVVGVMTGVPVGVGVSGTMRVSFAKDVADGGLGEEDWVW